MNCRQGDLAVIVRSYTGLNWGCIVRVIRLHDSDTRDLDGVRFTADTPKGPRWVVDPPLRSYKSNTVCSLYTVADAALRPIRDPGDDACDETLDWLPVPSTKEPA